MEKYTPLIFGLLSAGAITGILFFIYWLTWAGPRRIRRAVRARMGPAAIQSSIHTSLVYWILVSVVALILAVILGVYLWYHLGWWLYDDIFQDTWKNQLAFRLNATLWVMKITVEGLDYALLLPIGLLLSILLGLILGAYFGTKVGRIAAARRFFITRLMS